MKIPPAPALTLMPSPCEPKIWLLDTVTDVDVPSMAMPFGAAVVVPSSLINSPFSVMSCELVTSIPSCDPACWMSNDDRATFDAPEMVTDGKLAVGWIKAIEPLGPAPTNVMGAVGVPECAIVTAP